MKNFRFSLIADIHYGLFSNISQLDEESLTLRSREIDTTFKQAIDKSIEQGITHLFILGDLFHKRNQRTDAINTLVYNRLEYAKLNGLNVIVVVGNHDQGTISGNVNALETFKNVCEVISEPTILTLSGYDFYILPYEEFRGSAKSLEILLKRGKNTNRILLGHCGIEGTLLSGFDHVSREPLTVNELQFDKFIHAYFGHYHLPQNIGENGMYIGSMCQNSLQDKLADRGYVEATIKLENAKWVVDNKRVTLDSPKFYQVKASEYNPSDYIGKNYIKLTGCTRKQTEKFQKDNNVMSTIGEHLEEAIDTDSVIQANLSWENMVTKYITITEKNKRRHRRLKSMGKGFLNENR